MSNNKMIYTQELYRDLQRISVTETKVETLETIERITQIFDSEVTDFVFYCKYVLQATEDQFRPIVDYYYGKDTDKCLLEFRESIRNCYTCLPLVTELDEPFQFIIMNHNTSDDIFKVKVNEYFIIDNENLLKLLAFRAEIKARYHPWRDWIVIS